MHRCQAQPEYPKLRVLVQGLTRPGPTLLVCHCALPRPVTLSRPCANLLQHRDRCVCFSCKRALHTWEKGDSPLYEHCRWSPTCSFVQRIAADNLEVRPPRRLARRAPLPCSPAGRAAAPPRAAS